MQGAAALSPGHADQNLKKAYALGNALLLCCAAPWAMCTVIYSGAPVTLQGLLGQGCCDWRAMLAVLLHHIILAHGLRGQLVGLHCLVVFSSFASRPLGR